MTLTSLRQHLGDLAWHHLNKIDLHIRIERLDLTLDIHADGATITLAAQAGLATLDATLPIPGAVTREVDYACARFTHPAGTHLGNLNDRTGPERDPA